MNTHAIAETSIDTQLLERRLAELAVEDVITYDELNAVIGRDVQNGARHLLDSARRRLLTIHGRVMGCVKSVGIKRLDDHGIIGTGEQAVKHIHRTSRRAGRKLQAVQDYEALAKPDQSRLNLHRAMLGVLASATTPRRLKQLEARVGAELAPKQKMLDAIKDTL